MKWAHKKDNLWQWSHPYCHTMISRYFIVSGAACNRVSRRQILSSDNLSSNDRDVKKLSKVRIDCPGNLHLLINLSTTSGPWPNPVCSMFVALPQYCSALNQISIRRKKAPQLKAETNRFTLNELFSAMPSIIRNYVFIEPKFLVWINIFSLWFSFPKRDLTL